MITNRYAIILAGGVGERLWPLSTRLRPKQLLSVNGKETLLQQTIQRLKNCGFERENIGIITTQELYPLLYAHSAHDVGFFITEPESKNTGPAILWALLQHQKSDQDSYLFLPADHFVADEDLFATAVNQMMELAAEQKIIATMGIVPTMAATEYGYIEPEMPYQTNFLPLPVRRFVEKPNKETAEKFLAQGTLLWNSGMYAARKEVFVEAYKTHQPAMVHALTHNQYHALSSLSVDVAISEKSTNLMVVPSSCRWSDVGSIESYLFLTQMFKNHAPSLFEQNASGNWAYSNKKVVAFSGVDDVCIIETEEVIAVVKRGSNEHLKLLAQQIQKGSV